MNLPTFILPNTHTFLPTFLKRFSSRRHNIKQATAKNKNWKKSVFSYLLYKYIIQRVLGVNLHNMTQGNSNIVPLAIDSNSIQQQNTQYIFFYIQCHDLLYIIVGKYMSSETIFQQKRLLLSSACQNNDILFSWSFELGRRERNKRSEAMPPPSTCI